LAISSFQNSLYSLDKRFDPYNPGYSPDMSGRIDFKNEILNVLVFRAKALIAKADSKNGDNKGLDMALSSYRNAIRLISLLKDQYQRGEYSENFNIISQEVYKEAVDLAFRLYKKSHSKNYIKTAFEFSVKE